MFNVSLPTIYCRLQELLALAQAYGIAPLMRRLELMALPNRALVKSSL